MRRRICGMLLALALLVPGAAWGRPVGGPPEPFPFSDRYPAEVILNSPTDLAALYRLNIDIGDVRPARPAPPQVATVYINPQEAHWLTQAGLTATPIPNKSLRAFRAYGPGTASPQSWPTFEQFVTRMQGLAAAHPDLVRLVSIGQSVQGRDLWVLKITDNPDAAEDEPEFKYTSTMHGSEPVGTEMTLRLAELLLDNYGADPDLTALVDGMEIWLCPIHNPDGYVAGTRYNAHGADLNRDFPDPVTDPVDDPAGREPETQAFMYWGYDHRFVMGANYHTGAQVVNYPWDSLDGQYTPDDAIYYDYSVGYAVRNSRIWNGGWPNGVTIGWAWYVVYGGMQDWAYHWRGEHHVTIELSDTFAPPYSQMDTYWDENRAAMLWWMAQSLTGARGLVTDAYTGAPLAATVDVLEIGKPVQTDPAVGDYHRLLLPGAYTLQASAPGYITQTATVTVTAGAAVVHNFPLAVAQPTPPASLTVGGPTQGVTDVPYTFAAAVGPLTTTLPVVYVWQATDHAPITHTSALADLAVFTWDTPGPQAITVTAANAGGAVTATRAITIAARPTLTVTGPAVGAVGTGYAFTAAISPTTATQPITYTWQVSGRAPLAHTSGLSDTAVLSWTVAGPQAIIVVATNAQASASAQAAIQVAAGPLAGIAVQPNPTTLPVGRSRAFTATGADAFGNAVPISPTWATDAGTMAGNVLTAQTTVASSRHVTATVAASNGAARVDIVAGPVSRLVITPTQVTLPWGAPQQFSAAGFDAYSNTISGLPLFWHVASPAAGAIDAAGLFTAGAQAGAYPGAVVVSSSLVNAAADVTVQGPYQLYLPVVWRSAL